ncbi:MAG: APC family permease [Eggerthellaceae bacterium]|nr:APC family permease [Eggerthellaceae bacterium]
MSAENIDPPLQKTRMSTLGVVAIVFSFVAAGAFGIEEAISSCGPGLTLALLLIFPLVWSLPLSEMIAELGSLYPTEGGIYVWAKETFGEFWGWQAGFWGAVTTWLCQAQYVVLVAGYLGKLLEMSPSTVFAVKVGVIILFTLVNIVGLKWMERLETVFMVLVVGAFVAVTVVGFINWHSNPFTVPVQLEGGLFHSAGEGIAIIIWMYMGYECMSNMAGELENPQVIPKAMRIANPVIALSYILPTLAALAAIGSWNEWSVEQGSGTVGYADVLIQYVGSWAGVAVVIVAIIANCSIFCSYIAHGSRTFYVMAEDNMFPKFMGKLDSRGIPMVSMVVMAIFTIFTCQFDFATLVMATNPIQFYLYLLLVACVLKARKRYPAAQRKKMGLAVMFGGNAALYVNSALVAVICLLATFMNGIDYFVAGFLVLFLGLALYVFCKVRYKGQYLEDPEAFPIDHTTRLGVGDLGDMGSYLALTGAMALVGSAFLYICEHATGVAYYLEEYGEGFFSSFYGMLGTCVAIGVACLVAGMVVRRIASKRESAKIAQLSERRNQLLDEHIREIHGEVPVG